MLDTFICAVEDTRDEVTEQWRRLHNKELYNAYSPNIIRVIKIVNEIGGACSTYGREKTGAYRVLVGRRDRRRPLGKPSCRWEDRIEY